MASGLYERELLYTIATHAFSSINDLGATVALDVGANIGNHTVFFSQYFSHVIAFEPNPAALHLLKANLLMNGIGNVTVVEAGLGNIDSTLPFKITAGNLGGSGFITDSNRLSDLNLPVHRGDDVLTDLIPKERRLSFVKIDVEGYELEVIDGMRDTLTRHQPLVAFESHSSIGERGGAAIYGHLRDIGYRHLYTLETRKLFPEYLRFAPIKLVEKMLIGHSKYLTQIDTLENRFYSLLIASATSLQRPE